MTIDFDPKDADILMGVTIGLGLALILIVAFA